MAIVSARMTHHNPIGYLGAVVTALFTKLAFHNVNVNSWMAHFLSCKDKVIEVIKSQS